MNNNPMELVKKFLDKILCAISLIALILPIASVSMFGQSESANIFDLFSDYPFSFILLILLPILLIIVDFVPQIKPFKPFVAVGAPLLALIFAFVLRSGISSDSFGLADTGFGLILIILVNIALIVLGVLAHKDTFIALFSKKN